MLGVTLACASLLLAVGGVGVASMPPVHNVALPSIVSIYNGDDDYTCGVRPLDSTDNLYIDTTSTIVTCYYGDGENELDGDGGYSVFLITLDVSRDRTSNDQYPLATFASSYGDVPVIYLGLVPTWDYYYFELPDRTYWSYDSTANCYYLGVTWNCNVQGGVPYGSLGLMGNTVSDHVYQFSPVLPAELGADLNPISAIGDGLGVIPALGGGLTDGFDAVFVDNGALTAVGTFAFLLMGIGISVGIVKKCFNWVTGRHGM